MSHLTEIEYDGHEEHIFPCDCHSGHFLQFCWDSDPDYRYLWITSEIRHEGLGARIKDAWKVLRGKRCIQTEIVLTDETVKSLYRALKEGK